MSLTKAKQINDTPGKTEELPLGWAKLKDNNGYYYYNVMSQVKTRINPNRELSHNGNQLIDNVIEEAAVDSSLLRKDTWELLIGNIQKVVKSGEQYSVFKAMKAISQNVLKNHIKFRTLWADNKKVQQRILAHDGGYEFLMALGFREVEHRKLVCKNPNPSIINIAIEILETKLSLIEDFDYSILSKSSPKIKSFENLQPHPKKQNSVYPILLTYSDEINDDNKSIISNVTSSTMSIPSNFKFKDTKYIKEPYIIIIGISDYSEYDETGKSDLNATKNDVKKLTKLFHEKYEYEYVVVIQDYIDFGKTEKINDDTLIEFLHKQKYEIIKLCNNNKYVIDGIMLFYGGHGNEKGIILGNGDKVLYKDICDIFSNKSLPQLCNKPKLLHFDCCRGKASIKSIKFKQNLNDRNLELKEEKKSNDESENNNILNTNKYNDIMITYATINGIKAYDDTKYGHLSKSIYVVYKDMINTTNITLYDASLKIKSLVNYYSKSLQSCETVSRLDYHIKLISSSLNMNKFKQGNLETELGKYNYSKNSKNSKNNIKEKTKYSLDSSTDVESLFETIDNESNNDYSSDVYSLEDLKKLAAKASRNMINYN